MWGVAPHGVGSASKAWSTARVNADWLTSPSTSSSSTRKWGSSDHVCVGWVVLVPPAAGGDSGSPVDASACCGPQHGCVSS